MKKNLIVILLLLALGVFGCSRNPAYVGDYSYSVSKEMMKLSRDMALAFTKSDPKMTAEAEQSIKKLEEDMAKATFSIKANGKCVVSIPNQPDQTLDYTFADNKLTIKAAPKGLVMSGSDIELTWDEAKGTLTGGIDPLSFTLKKK